MYHISFASVVKHFLCATLCLLCAPLCYFLNFVTQSFTENHGGPQRLTPLPPLLQRTLHIEPLLRCTSPPAPSPEGEGVGASEFFIVYLHYGFYKEVEGLSAASRGARGNVNTAHALRNSMTEAEKILWDEIMNRKLQGLKFRRQHPILWILQNFTNMKTLLSFTLMFGISILSFSQTWAPVGAKWYYSHKIGMGTELTVVESIGDTMLDGKQCSILKSYMIYAVMFPNGTYRYDTLICPMQYSYYESGKVYLYDSILADFLVLYNFNATAGSIQTVIDTPFPGFCPETTNSSLFQYQVNTVNDTIINGIALIRQYTSPTQDADWVFSDPNGMVGDYQIIERIGSAKYLFGVTLYQAMEGSICCLRCYQDSNIFYKASFWPESLSCDYLTPLYTHVNEMDNFKNNLKIAPNPFRDYISIDNQSETEIRDYELFNSIGLLVNSGVVNESHIFISTNHLSPGFYFLKLKTEHLDFFSKIIKN